MRSFAPLVCCVLVLAAIGPYTATGQATPTVTAASGPEEPSIHAVYPDPVAGGDEGEFVVITVPAGTDIGQYAITDGDGTAGVPNTTARGRVVLSMAPNRTRKLTDWPVVGLDGHLALANGGERIQLQRGNRTVDAVRYTDSVEGELGVINGSVVRWQSGCDRPPGHQGCRRRGPRVRAAGCLRRTDSTDTERGQASVLGRVHALFGKGRRRSYRRPAPRCDGSRPARGRTGWQPYRRRGQHS